MFVSLHDVLRFALAHKPSASRRRGRANIALEELRPAEPPKKEEGRREASPLPQLHSHLALGDDRRWGFTLADASAARDAEESKHRSRC